MTDMYLHIGYGDSVTGYSNMEHEWGDGGFEAAVADVSYGTTKEIITHTFTNTSGFDRIIREVGCGTYYTPTQYGRVVLDLDDMPNNCVVPAGASVKITYWWWHIEPNNGRFAFGEIDTALLSNPDAAIHYNGVELPNARIASIDKTGNAHSWKFVCSTPNKSDIDALMVYAAPISIDYSILGKTYIRSPKRAGTLNILDVDTGVYAQYINCYMDGPLSATPIMTGNNDEQYIFEVNIAESGYDEVLI